MFLGRGGNVGQGAGRSWEIVFQLIVGIIPWLIFCWKGGFVEDALSGGGVGEAELTGVEHEAAGVGEFFI